MKQRYREDRKGMERIGKVRERERERLREGERYKRTCIWRERERERAKN